MAYSEKAKALRQCKALRKDGKPCQAYAVWGENFCMAHSGRHHRGLMPHPYERRFKRLSRQSPTCHCPAYNWPHRPGGIAQDKYDKKATELKQRQYELADRLKRVTEADESYSITLITLLNLCSRAPELFESSEVEQKRQLVNFLLSNLKLRGKNLEFTLKKPFDVLVDLDYRSSWLPPRCEISNLFLKEIIRFKNLFYK